MTHYDFSVVVFKDELAKESKEFKLFLRDLFMHGIVATSYGGALTCMYSLSFKEDFFNIIYLR